VSDKLKRFAHSNKQLLGMVAAIAVMFVVLSFTVKDFMSYQNITNLLSQLAPIAIMASGVTFVLVTGGMDISCPAVMAASAVVGVYYMTATGNLVIGTLIVLAVAAALGLINGFAIAKLKMVPLVVTLSMMTVATGLATILSGSIGLPILPPTFSNFFNKYTVIGMLIVIAGVLDYILKGTSFGREIYYIGNNPNAARVSGVNNDQIVVIAYVICGVCAGIAGIINIASISTARANMGPQSQILDIISAAVIGGVSVNGGRGRVRDACLGALLIVGVNNVMNMLGVSDYYTTLIKGSIIIFAMGIASFRSYLSAKKGV
jgi:ribose/xylose/arabinose/galactoside ABC-type transport system permease subunit